MAKLLGKSIVPEELRKLRLRSGLSMGKIADGLGLAGASSYQRYEDPDRFKKHSLPLDIAQKLARVLSGKGEPPIEPADVLWLSGLELDDDGRITGFSIDTMTELADKGVQAIEADLGSVRTDGLVGERDFPIYASAQGGPDGMVTDFEIVEVVKRPEPLANVKRGFGMYVVGDSMEPAYRQGDSILCHPNLPPRTGDDVLVIKVSKDNSHSCLVKQFISANSDIVRLRQHNPPDEFSVSRAIVQAIHVIVGKYSRR